MLLSENAYMQSRRARKSGRGGRSLLAGLLRCGRCGRMLNVPRTKVRGGNRAVFSIAPAPMINHGPERAASDSVAGGRTELYPAESLHAIEGTAVEAVSGGCSGA